MLYMLSLFDKKPQKKYVVAASAILAVILIIRFSYVLLIPALVITFLFPVKHLFTAIISFVSSYGLLKIIPMLTNNTSELLPETAWVVKGAHPNYVFQSGIDTGSNTLYLFFLILGFVFLYYFEKYPIVSKLSKVSVFSIISAFILLAYYASSSFHPQYLTWIVPFFLISIIKDRSGYLFKTFWLSLVFYFIYVASWGNDVTFGLATPVSIVFDHIEPKWFFPILPFTRWANIGKTMFSAFALYWIYFIGKTIKNEK